MKSQATSVPDYLAELPDDRRAALTKLRSVLRKAAPDAKEAIAHGMPSYELDGMLYAMASQKNHMALYVCEPEIVDAHRDALGKLNCGKGCIRFRTYEELPVDAIATIVREAHAKRSKAS
jgi:uncharacterized protein YdhG (YjbR/CyaY superfamily)